MDGFEGLGQLAAHHHLAFTEDASDGFHRILHPARRLVEHQGAGIFDDGLQPIVAALGFRRQKSFEGEAICGQTGGRECSDGGARARQRHHLDPGLATAGDQVIAGVADERRARIRDQGDALAFLDPADQHIRLLLLVVIVQGEGRHRYLVVAEQDAGMPGIFGGHQIDAA
ncbi:hypothetical protein D3C77_119310 [compost metagenome]